MKSPEIPLSSSENVEKRKKISYIIAFELYSNAEVFLREPALERWQQLFETGTEELEQRYESARTIIEALDPVGRATLLSRAITFGQD